MLNSKSPARVTSGRAIPRRRRGHRLLVPAALLLLLVGFAAAASAQTTKPTLTIGSLGFACGNQDPSNPGGISGEIGLSYEPLIRRAGGRGTLGAPTPGLATSWGVKPGNKVITLTLRRNARFSDGTPVTASAVKIWLDYKNSTTPNPNFPIRSTDVLSRYVVRITLKSPNPIFVQTLSQTNVIGWQYVPSPKAVAELRANPRSTVLSQSTRGAGPYVLDPSQSLLGDRCVYVPNSLYFDKSRVRWSRVITRNLTDPNAALAALRAGQIDVLQRGDPNTAAAAAASGFNVIKSYGGFRGIFFLDKSGKLAPGLGDVRVRQALNYAVDKRTIARAFYRNDARITSVPNPGNEEDPKDANYYSYNPAKARSLLAAAGYSNGFKLTLFCQGPWAGAFNFGSFFEAVAKSMATSGITLDVRTTATQAEFGQSFGSRTFPSVGLNFGKVSTWEWFGFNFKPGGATADQHGWQDPVLTRLYLRAQRANPKKADALWRQFIHRQVTQAYFVPVISAPFYTFSSKRVSGITPAVVTSNDATEWYPTAG